MGGDVLVVAFASWRGIASHSEYLDFSAIFFALVYSLKKHLLFTKYTTRILTTYIVLFIIKYGPKTLLLAIFSRKGETFRAKLDIGPFLLSETLLNSSFLYSSLFYLSIL